MINAPIGVALTNVQGYPTQVQVTYTNRANQCLEISGPSLVKNQRVSDSFLIHHKMTQEEPTYLGPMRKSMPTFINLPPNGSQSVQIDLAQAYELTPGLHTVTHAVSIDYRDCNSQADSQTESVVSNSIDIKV